MKCCGIIPVSAASWLCSSTISMLGRRVGYNLSLSLVVMYSTHCFSAWGGPAFLFSAADTKSDARLMLSCSKARIFFYESHGVVVVTKFVR